MATPERMSRVVSSGRSQPQWEPEECLPYTPNHLFLPPLPLTMLRKKGHGFRLKTGSAPAVTWNGNEAQAKNERFPRDVAWRFQGPFVEIQWPPFPSSHPRACPPYARPPPCPPHTMESLISEPSRTRGLGQVGEISTRLSFRARGLFSDSEKLLLRSGEEDSWVGLLLM